MTSPDSADDPSATGQDRHRSFRLRVPARAGAAQRRFVSVARSRFEGSAAQSFLSRLAAVDFADSIIGFGASLLLSVLPFITLLGSRTGSRGQVPG